MCGIIGKYSNKIIDKNLIKDQLEMTSRRGPDNSGFWISENQNLGLGSNRLSIQDISSQANMPFISIDKRLVIVFNGEIYNYRILQKQLINLGYEFVTNSDTEVILNLYKEYGEKCLNKLEGMFAFCIYDKNRNSLFLARDISGQKPLYYFTNKNIFSFSSHLNQLILDIDISKKINHSALYNYLIYGYSLSGETLIDGIQKLEPGNYLELNLNNLNLKKHSYWEIDNERNLIHDENIILNLLDKKLNASVKNHLISDRSTGILLSGGIDSSLIAYYSAINSNKKINTYNVTFKNFPNYDESKYAKQISSFIDTNHFEINGDEVSYDLIDQIIGFMGEPIADSSLLPTTILFKHLNDKSTVLLGGDGGDELFAGYPSYFNNNNFQLPFLNDFLISKLPTGFKGRNFLLRLNSDKYSMESDYKYFNKYDLDRLIKGFDHKHIFFDKIYDSKDFIYDMTKKDFLNYLSEDILVKVDRASMYSSIEARSPFLDKNIIEFAFCRVPSDFKIKNGQLKYILKKLFTNKIKVDYNLDRKQGFSIPLDYWVRDIWYDQIFEEFNDLPEIFNKKFVLKSLENIKSGYSNSSNILSLVFLLKWLRINNLKL